MSYEYFLRKLNITQIKFIIKMYNLNSKIVVSKKKRDELIEELLKHTTLDDKGETIILKNHEIVKKSNIPNYDKNAGDLTKLTTSVLIDKLKVYSEGKYKDDSMRSSILEVLSKREEASKKRKDKTRFTKLSVEELRKRINKATQEQDEVNRKVYQDSLDYKLKQEKKKK
jgi:Glu-tRNA(Gln) amidotransferase subunit E-like FAD-binding protein